MDPFHFVGKEGDLGTELDWDAVAVGLDIPELDGFYNPNRQASAVAFQQQPPQSISAPTALSVHQQSPQSFAPAQTNITAASLPLPHYVASNQLYIVDQTKHTMMRTPMKGMHQQQQLFTPPPTCSLSLSLDDIVSKGAEHPSTTAVFDATDQHRLKPAIFGPIPFTNTQLFSVGLQQQFNSPRSILSTQSTSAIDLYRPLLQSTDIATSRSQYQQNTLTPQSAHAARIDPVSCISSPAMSWNQHGGTSMSHTGYNQAMRAVGYPHVTPDQQVMSANIDPPPNVRSVPTYMSQQAQRSQPTNQPPLANLTTDQKNLYMARASQIRQYQMKIMQETKSAMPDHPHRPMNSNGGPQRQFRGLQCTTTPIPHMPQRPHGAMNALVRMGMKNNGTLGQPIDLTSPTSPPSHQVFGSKHTPMVQVSQPMSRNSSSGVSHDSGISMTPPANFHQSAATRQRKFSASTSASSEPAGNSLQAPASRQPVPIPSMLKKRELQELAGPDTTMDGTNSAPPPKKRRRPAGSKTKASPGKNMKAKTSSQRDVLLIGSQPFGGEQPLESSNKINNADTPEYARLFGTLACAANSNARVPNLQTRAKTHSQLKRTAVINKQSDRALKELPSQCAAVELGPRLFGNQLKQGSAGPANTQAAKPCLNQTKPGGTHPSDTIRTSAGNELVGSTARQLSTARAPEQVTGPVSCKPDTCYPPSKATPTPNTARPAPISEEDLAHLLTAEIRQMDKAKNSDNLPVFTQPTLSLVHDPVTSDEYAKVLLEEQKAIASAHNGRFAPIPDYQAPAADHWLDRVHTGRTDELGKTLMGKMDLPERWVEVGLGGYVPPHRR